MSIEEEITKRGNFLNGKNFKTIKSKSLLMNARNLLNENNLVKDEIVSVANGNIQKFEIISEVQIPNGGYTTSLKATVSVTKLTSFVESKGVVVEFKGSLFSFNINQLILNEANESKAIEEITSTTLNIISKSFLLALPENYSFFHPTSHEWGKGVVYCCYITL